MLSDKLISSLASHFRVENNITETEDKAFLVTTVMFKSKILYTHHLDLEPLYQIMIKRIDRT
jgi:hypothetical protein